jgi:hypothetical protein
VPSEYTGIVLVVAGAALITVGALAGPETKDVDFAPSAEREVVPS